MRTQRSVPPQPAASSSPQRLSPTQLHSILDRMAEGVVSMTAEGRILLANAAARRLLGFPEQHGQHERLWERSDLLSLRELVNETHRSGAPQVRELSLHVPEERIVQAQVMADESRADQPAVFIVLHDVTELRRLERVRQDFVANVSHELRTPLTSITGFIETLLQGAIDEPDHNRRFLTLVEEDVNRLARLTDDLLELSKVESLGRPKTTQAVNVPRIIQDVVAALKPQIQAKQITIAIQSGEHLPEAQGDPDQIRQVFWNLLDNAIKYNVEEGRIEVAVESHGPWLSARVTDSGIGIPADELPRIFERFYRVDKARSRALGGTGLGLSIVKHIVEAHGGEVTVTSEPSQGSTFQFTLPVWRH